jgi:deoxyribonuclease V
METVKIARTGNTRDKGTDPASIARMQKIQETLRRQCSVRPFPELSSVSTIAGADASYDGDTVYTAVVLMAFPGMSEIQSVAIRSEAPFPYISGYFAFREGPGIIEAVGKLREKPGVLIINGHGIAHPRRFGIASHVGVLLDMPAIGVTRRLMTGNYTFPLGQDPLKFPVYMGGEPVAMGIRKKPGSRPIFISPGHKVSLDQSVEIVTMVTGHHRLPEPLRRAHMLARIRVREYK